MYQNIFVSVVAPVYNEETVIEAFLTRTEAVLKQTASNYEIIIVDDGSIDDTVDIVKRYAETHSSKIRIIVFSRNYGHEIALSAGIEHARGDYIIQMDADLQHPPELIPKLLNKILEGFDVVYAARTERHNESWMKRFSSWLFYNTARKMSGFDIPTDATNYRVITQKIARSFKRLRENNRHILMLYAYIGFKTSSVPFVSETRFAGKTKYSYRKLFNLAVDSIISFSHRPLRYMSLLCVFISVIMASYAGFILLQKIFSHQQLAEGMASVIFIISSLFAMLFLFLAVISEYIGRILIESKNRPLYYIKEEYELNNIRKTAD